MSYTRFGLGAAAPGSTELAGLMQKYGVDDGGYSSAVLGVFDKVASPEVVATLTPVIQMGILLGKAAINEISAVAGSAASSPGFPAAVVGFVNDVTGLATSISSTASEAVSIVSDAVPIVGMAISMFTSGAAMMKASKDAAFQKIIDTCNNPDPNYGRYLPVVGSARGHTQKPADIFVAGLADGSPPEWSPWTPAVPAQTTTGPTGKVFVLKPGVPAQWNPIPTDLGDAFIAVTEGDDGGYYQRTWGTPGPTPATKALFQFIRKAIQASAKRPELTDGGASLWPVYIDLLRREFDSGRITAEYARYMWVLASQKIGWDMRNPAPDDMSLNPTGSSFTNAMAARAGRFDLMSPYEAASNDAARIYTGYWDCKKFDQRAIDTLIQTVVNWRDTVNPAHLKWGSDIAQFKAEQANLVKEASDIARQMLGLPPVSTQIKFNFPPDVVACIKAKGKWNPTYQTCTVTRAGKPVVQVYNPVSKSLTDPAVTIVKGVTPLEGILIGGVIAAGAVVAVKIIKKRRRARA